MSSQIWYELLFIIWLHLFGVMLLHKPVVCEQSGSTDIALVADLCVQGVWIPQAETLLDIHMVLIPSLTGTTLPWLFIILQSMIKSRSTHKFVETIGLP